MQLYIYFKIVSTYSYTKTMLFPILSTHRQKILVSSTTLLIALITSKIFTTVPQANATVHSPIEVLNPN